MKKSLSLLFMGVSAFALPKGEWKEVGRNRYLSISPKTFIFRNCGRYSVIKKSKHSVTLFTGRDLDENSDECLGRGEHVCAWEVNDSRLTLDCGEWKKVYLRD